MRKQGYSQTNKHHALLLTINNLKNIQFEDQQTRNKLQNKMVMLRESQIRTPSTLDNYQQIHSCELKSNNKTQRQPSLHILHQHQQHSNSKILTLRELKQAQKLQQATSENHHIIRKKSSSKLLVTLSANSKQKRKISTQIKPEYCQLSFSPTLTQPKLKVSTYKNMARKLQTFK